MVGEALNQASACNKNQPMESPATSCSLQFTFCLRDNQVFCNACVSYFRNPMVMVASHKTKKYGQVTTAMSVH